MIRLFGPVKKITAVAVSGGPDSMAALTFLGRTHPDLTAFYFHHGTEHGEIAHAFVKDFCNQKGIRLIIGHLTSEKPDGDSWEEFWRNQRYTFLHSQKNHLIATAQHLDDVAETYLWSCLHGQARFIHYCQPGPNGPTNIIRPFLLTTKRDLLDWCQRHQIPYLLDPSNEDTSYARNRIRHKLMPEALQINPGLLTVVKKLLVKRLNEEHHE